MNNAIELPNNEERKKIFYWLKKISSLTTWRHILPYYQAWADTIEESVRQASNNYALEKSSLKYDDYVEILKGLAEFSEGLTLLSHGDKRVFQYNSHGKFVIANRLKKYWFTGIWGRGEFGIDIESTPNWSNFVTALQELSKVQRYYPLYIFQPMHIEGPAPYYFQKDVFPRRVGASRFPPLLPDVPLAASEVLVATGERLPGYSGIWEPVALAHSSIPSLRSHTPPQAGPITGAMNYLHSNQPAPRALVYRSGSNTHPPYEEVNTVWRLIWRDDRYEDGTIPQEELEYVYGEFNEV